MKKLSLTVAAAALLFLFSGFAYSQKNAELVKTKQFIAAFNGRNLDAMMALAADDIKWYAVAGDRITTETANKTELRAFLEGYFKSCPTCRSKISGISQSGSSVTMTETATWKSGGKTHSNSSAAVYEFEKGLIARVYYHGPPSKSTFDAALAKRLGADERGMKAFVFVNLIRGKKQFAKEERDRLIAGHMENIGRLAASGKLVLAGPFFDDNDIRGIYIFDVDTLEKARALTESDPAVKAGVFEFEMRLWYGSAALLELNRIHGTVQKSK